MVVEQTKQKGAVVDLRGSTPRVSVADDRAVAFVDLAAENRVLERQLTAAIAGVVERGDFVLGSAVTRFEQEFAAFCEVEHAVGVDSGFSALELLIRAYGIGPGDEVITAANTFMATVGAIQLAGATPVLVDADPLTLNLDPRRVEAVITPRTRGMIPVHLYGQPAEMDPLRVIADRHRLVVIEDACQAHGARYKGRRAGSLGDAAAFSFYPAKNLGAFGDGGMAVTNDAEVADRLRLLRNLGSRVKYHHEVTGFNHRLDSLHAAVLSVKLPHLDSNNQLRRQAAATYFDLLQDLPIELPPVVGDTETVYHLFVIRTDRRRELIEHLSEQRIGVGIHYPIPPHLQPAFPGLGDRGDFPVTETQADRILSLPMHPGLSFADVAWVSQAITEFFERR